MKYKKLLYKSAFVACAAFSVNAQEDIDLSIQKNIGKVESDMAKKVSLADMAIEQAGVYSRNKEYLKAALQYLKGVNLLEECNSNSPFVKQKIEAVSVLLNQNYNYYAEELIDKVKDAIRDNELKKADSLCDEIVKVSTDKDILKEAKRLKDVVTVALKADIKTLDAENEKEKYDIDILNRRGKELFKKKRYKEALDVLEEVMVLDPYNSEAIELIRKVYNKTIEIGELRSHATRDERVAELIWKTVSPIKSDKGNKQVNEGQIKKVDETAKIKEKLKSIKFPHIEYDELSINAVVKDLKRRSKQLDEKDGTGVNIFLRLASDLGTTSKDEEDDATSADSDDDDMALDDDLGGDDEDFGDDDSGDDDFGDDDSGDDDFGDDDGAGGGDSDEIPTVSMVVDDISLLDVIKFVCQTANLKYRIEKYAVVIAQKSVPFEELETRIYPVSQDAELDDDVKTYFTELGVNFDIKGSNIVFDSKISRLIATNTPENLAKVEAIMSELNVGNPMVVIETKFVEINQNDLDQLTIAPRIINLDGDGTTDATFKSSYDRTGSRDGAKKSDGTSDIQSVTYSEVDGKGNYDWDVMIKAVDRMESTNFLSTPRIVTLSGQEAEIKVVNKIYYPEDYSEASATDGSTESNDSTDTSAGVVNTVSYTPGNVVGPFPQFGDVTEEGIIFTVTPEVDLETGVITLQMSPTFTKKIGEDNYSDVIGYYSGKLMADLGVAVDRKFPIMRKRSVTTTVSIYDGGSIVLGGSLVDATEEVVDKTPILSDLPLIGASFTHKYTKSNKKNLLIFLNAHLINPDGSLFNEPTPKGLPVQRR